MHSFGILLAVLLLLLGAQISAAWLGFVPRRRGRGPSPLPQSLLTYTSSRRILHQCAALFTSASSTLALDNEQLMMHESVSGGITGDTDPLIGGVGFTGADCLRVLGYNPRKQQLGDNGGIIEGACPHFSRWENLINNRKARRKITEQPTYNGFPVCCDDWLRFSEFRAWSVQHDATHGTDTLIDGRGINNCRRVLDYNPRQQQLGDNGGIIEGACPHFSRWIGLLQGSSSKARRNVTEQPTYNGFPVCCDDWLRFSEFRAWSVQHDATHGTDTLIDGRGINDCRRVLDYNPRQQQLGDNGGIIEGACPHFSRWKSLLQGCSDKARRNNTEQQTYHGFPLCDGWLRFSEFRAWSAQHDATHGTDTLVDGKGINDAQRRLGYNPSFQQLGPDGEPINGKGRCPYYTKWENMLERCYSAALHDKRPTSIGCSVCEEWLSFFQFRAWMVQHDGYWEGTYLSHSVLSRDNKVYSPETCFFVTRDIVDMFNECAGARGNSPLGVCWDESPGKYKAQLAVEGTRKHIGHYDTDLQAHQAWLPHKRVNILRMIDKHLPAGVPYHARLRKNLIARARYEYADIQPGPVEVAASWARRHKLEEQTLTNSSLIPLPTRISPGLPVYFNNVRSFKKLGRQEDVWDTLNPVEGSSSIVCFVETRESDAMVIRHESNNVYCVPSLPSHEVKGAHGIIVSVPKKYASEEVCRSHYHLVVKVHLPWALGEPCRPTYICCSYFPQKGHKDEVKESKEQYKSILERYQNDLFVSVGDFQCNHEAVEKLLEKCPFKVLGDPGKITFNRNEKHRGTNIDHIVVSDCLYVLQADADRTAHVHDWRSRDHSLLYVLLSIPCSAVPQLANSADSQQVTHPQPLALPDMATAALPQQQLPVLANP